MTTISNYEFRKSSWYSYRYKQNERYFFPFCAVVIKIIHHIFTQLISLLFIIILTQLKLKLKVTTARHSPFKCFDIFLRCLMHLLLNKSENKSRKFLFLKLIEWKQLHSLWARFNLMKFLISTFISILSFPLHFIVSVLIFLF